MNILHPRALLRAAVPTLIASTSVAAPAAARPSLTTDRACYSEGETMTFTGQGFTPGAGIAFFLAANGVFGQASTTADPAGAFSYPLRAPTLKDFKAESPAFDLSVTANDQTKFGPDGPIGPPEDSVGIADVRISEWSVDVAQWDTPRAAARRGQRVRLTTRGWTSAGDTLYIHYIRAGKALHSEKVGALKAACGDLTKTIKTFNFKSARPGTYAVRFSTSPKWSRTDAWLGYRAVRLAT